MIARSPATSSADSGVPRAASRRAASAAGGAVEGQGDQHGALALDQVVAGGLAGRRRVAVHAEQVVAELEGLAERQPVRRQLPQHVRCRRRRARRRCGADARWSTWRTCSAAPSSRPRRRPGRAPARTRRGTGRRSPRCGTGRTRSSAVATRSAGSPQRRSSSSDQESSRSPSRMAAAAPYCSGSPRHAGRPVRRPRTRGASPAGRAGCRRRPCSRRGPARWRAAAPGPRTRAAARPRRLDLGLDTRGSPTSRTPPGTACRRTPSAGPPRAARRRRARAGRAARPARRGSSSRTFWSRSRKAAHPVTRPTSVMRARLVGGAASLDWRAWHRSTQRAASASSIRGG